MNERLLEKSQAYDDEMDAMSDEQDFRQEVEKLRKVIRQKRQHRRENSKMIIGTGWTFDMTDFFKFKDKKKRQGRESEIFQTSNFAWFMLLYSVVNVALLPIWSSYIRVDMFLKTSWRFLFQGIILIPFVMYEMRIDDARVKQQYTLRHMFLKKGFLKVYVSGLSTTIWFSIALTCTEWTHCSHAFVLAEMSNFFLSLGRSYRGANHKFQNGGQVFMLAGILFIILDSITLIEKDYFPTEYHYLFNDYLHRNYIARVLGDLAAIGVAFAAAQLSNYTADLRDYYPPYLALLMSNIVIYFNMTLVAFFWHGATFDFHKKSGVFNLISSDLFSRFLYLGILLCLGLFISFSFVTRLFKRRMIPGTAMIFEPILTTFFMELFGLQALPGSLSIVGFVLLIPGQFFIIWGHTIYLQKSQKVEIQEKQRLTRMISMRQQKISMVNPMMSKVFFQGMKQVKEQLYSSDQSDVNQELDSVPMNSSIKQLDRQGSRKASGFYNSPQLLGSSSPVIMGNSSPKILSKNSIRRDYSQVPMQKIHENVNQNEDEDDDSSPNNSFKL